MKIVNETPIQRCKTCGRVEWDGSRAMSINECHLQGGDLCRLIRDQNSLLAGIKKLARARCDEATTKAVMAVVETISPTTTCPICEKPHVVGARQTVNIHYAKTGDQLPCSASFKTVIGGMIFEVKK